MLKKMLIGVGVFVILAVGVFVWQRNREVFIPVDDKEFLKTSPSEREIEKYLKNMETAYAKDTYGGDTPEETLNLFIDALKKGDTDLAAKYFLLEKQAKMAEELAVSKQNNVLPLLIGDLEKEKTGGGDEQRYTFTTFDDNNVTEFSFELIKNPYTKKWKIENL